MSDLDKDIGAMNTKLDILIELNNKSYSQLVELNRNLTALSTWLHRGFNFVKWLISFLFILFTALFNWEKILLFS